MKNLDQQTHVVLNLLQKNHLHQSDDFFTAQAERLFTGLLMYVADTPDEWGQVNNAIIMQYRKQSFLANEEEFLRYVESRKLRHPLSFECIEYLRAYLQLSEKVRNSVDIVFDQMCDRSDQKDFRIAT